MHLEKPRLKLELRFKLVAIKLVTPPRELLEKHYADLSDKPFFPNLVSCEWNRHPAMASGADMNCRHAERPHLRHDLGGT